MEFTRRIPTFLKALGVHVKEDGKTNATELAEVQIGPLCVARVVVANRGHRLSQAATAKHDRDEREDNSDEMPLVVDAETGDAVRAPLEGAAGEGAHSPVETVVTVGGGGKREKKRRVVVVSAESGDAAAEALSVAGPAVAPQPKAQVRKTRPALSFAGDDM